LQGRFFALRKPRTGAYNSRVYRSQAREAATKLAPCEAGAANGVNNVAKFKMKTHKGTAKRFRVTGSGKIVRTKGGKTHFRRRRDKRVKQKLDKMLVVKAPGQVRRIRTLAPYIGLYKANPPA
jgi:large subunit ribosomal protein L35